MRKRLAGTLSTTGAVARIQNGSGGESHTGTSWLPPLYKGPLTRHWTQRDNAGKPWYGTIATQ